VEKEGEDPVVNPFLPETMETIVNAVTPGNSGSVLVRTNTDNVREGGEDPAVNPFLPETMETIVNYSHSR